MLSVRFHNDDINDLIQLLVLSTHAKWVRGLLRLRWIPLNLLELKKEINDLICADALDRRFGIMWGHFRLSNRVLQYHLFDIPYWFAWNQDKNKINQINGQDVCGLPKVWFILEKKPWKATDKSTQTTVDNHKYDDAVGRYSAEDQDRFFLLEMHILKNKKRSQNQD